MKNRIVSSLCLALFLFIPAKSYSYTIRDIDITPYASVSERYDDNITYTKSNKKDDLITELNLGLNAKYEGKLRSLEFTGNINHEMFSEYDNFNNTSEDFTLNFLNEFSKYDRINIKNTFIHAEEPRSFEDEFGRTTGRYSYLRNRFNCNYVKELTKQLSLIARYANDTDNFSRDDLSDSYQNRIGIESDYAVSSSTILLGSYDFSTRKFHPGKDAFTNTLAAGVRQYLTKQLYFDGKAGFDFIRSYNDKSYNKPLFVASLTDDVDETTSASISYTTQYYTNSYTQDLFNYWQVSAGLKRQLTKRLGINFSGFVGEGEYTSLNITDKFKGASAGFVYAVTRNIKGNLSYSYSRADSNSDTREYSKNSVLAGLNIAF